MTGSEIVKIELAGRVVTATIDSPPANALSLELAEGLQRVCEATEQAGARVVVLRSAVAGYFVAGADLKLLGSADDDDFDDYLVKLRAAIERLATLDAVSIAAISGYALGGGLELACACTLRVAAEDAQIGVPEVKLGLLPGAGGTQRLPRLIGVGSALDLLLTGRSISGTEGYRLGLVQRLAATRDDVDAMAAEFAAELALLPAGALAAIKRCVAATDLPFDHGMAVEVREIKGLFKSEDAREGLAAFLGKRAPRFE